jgi:aminocarboxymuconate-semialdehyde decarboxylase
MKLDVFNHIFPKRFYDRMLKVAPDGKDMHKRVRAIPAIVDLADRFRIMDMFDDYAQVISLGSPPIEAFGPAPLSTELARLANDGMAELVAKHPDRFPAFIASLPMNDPQGLLDEAERAVRKLGAVGVQVFTNVLGAPLTAPETLPLFGLMAELDLPIWMHPARGADFPDYQKEKKSHYEIWWTFGWPYETSAAMAHIVFEGLFDKHPAIKIITHHMGGMIPFYAGKIDLGFDQIFHGKTDENPVAKKAGLRPARSAHLRRRLYEAPAQAQEKAGRLLPHVLRRHGALRRLGSDQVRAEVLRTRARAVRLGFAVRSGEGLDVHTHDHRDRRPAGCIAWGAARNLRRQC